MTEEKYLNIDFCEYTHEDIINVINTHDVPEAGWTSSYEEWSEKNNMHPVSRETCEQYFVGYALSPVVIHNSNVHIGVYIDINSSIENTLDKYKDKKMLLHRVDSRYIRVIFL